MFVLLPVVLWSATGCDATGTSQCLDIGGSGKCEDAGADAPPDAPPDVEEVFPCGQDCSKIEAPPCYLSVCNDPNNPPLHPGTVGACIIIPAPETTACDDKKFCTLNDHCDGNGQCVGGDQNRCGIKPDPCSSITCYEELQKCDSTPSNDGASCEPKDLCKVNGVCKTGECIGVPKDCTFSPLSECNLVGCNSATGKCEPTPDSTKDGRSCVLTGDLCQVNKTCLAGQCVGGVPKDCSGLNVGCNIGVCNDQTGLCGPADAPVGTACTPGTAECQVGACNDKGACIASSAPDGTICNDFDACTQGSKCSGGVCSKGTPVVGCSTYVHEGFESCPSGWTFGGDWECGTPMNVGPPAAYYGSGAIATQIAGLYHVNQNYTTAVANSPVINLMGATNPMVSFWAWDHTEGGVFDGWNLKISTNGGQTFAPVMTVTPAYNLTIAGQPAWGGDHSADGWQNYMADLTAYAGQSVILQYSFRSDGATVYPGVYVDEVIVAEPLQIPMFITTGPQLPDVYTGMDYSVPITKLGGTNTSVWSIKPGGKNTSWLTIDSAGVLKGTPKPTDVGQVIVTVHVEEPALPSNFAEKTFTFNVLPNAYYTSFEGMCPNGWTLTGDWQCGTPTMVGPATAYVGTQCIGTQLGGLYSNGQTWAGTTATSPDIDLTNYPNAMLTFRMWMDTEGSTYDGVNLKVSTDGGMNYSIVTGISPPYTLTIGGQSAWGGHGGAFGWQYIQADLSPYAGQVVRLRFGFQSDSSGQFPGVYIDDFFIN